jgi:predicted amidophosphoribosyltransferase
MIFRVAVKRWYDIAYLADYHPVTYRGRNGRIGSSRYFDEHSREILNLKYSDSNSLMDAKVIKKNKAIEHFCEMLDQILASDFAVAVVPSHKPSFNVSGICIVARRLAQSNGRIDATDCLVRKVEIKPLHERSPRAPSIHFNSIVVEHPEQVVGKEVLLLDDIVTSGNSINVCRKKLKDNGARKVECLVLGKTV